jgi:tetratricopeptide (TPR) repeat protein
MYSARREVDGVVAVNAVRVRLLLRRGEPEKAARACLDNVANLQGMEASQHAEDSCREAARIGEAYNLPVLRAKAMFELNVILGRQGRWQEALEYGELVADLFLELGRPKDAMSVSLNNARFAGRLADHRKRLSWAKRAADLAKRADDQQRHSLAMFQMAYAHCALGDPWEELGASLLAERLSEKLEHWWNAAIGARGAAYAALRLNQPDMARASLTRAVGYLAHGEDLAAKYVETLVDLSSLQVTAEEYEAAASTLAQATRKAAESGSNVPPLIKREAETRAAIVNGFLHRHPSTESSALASSQPDATGTEANQDTTDEVLDAALELFKAWQTVWGSETRFHAVNWGFATGS